MNRPTHAPATPQSRPANSRAAVSNGKLPKGVCPRSAEARRWLDVTHDLSAELGGKLTMEESLLVRAVAMHTLALDRMQEAALRGEPVDDEALTRATNAIARDLATLRRGRTPRKSKGGLTLLERINAEAKARERSA
jgi:hypothetical protein